MESWTRDYKSLGNIFGDAIDGGHLELLQWLIRKLPITESFDYWVEYAAHLGKENIFNWMQNYTKETFKLKLRLPTDINLEDIDWSQNTKYTLAIYMYDSAAANGHFHILKLLYQQGVEWSDEICTHAAKAGRLDIIQWALDKGCPWSLKACTAAAEVGSLDILNFALSNGYKWDMRGCIEAATQRGDLSVLQFLKNNSDNWASFGKLICENSAIYGHLKILTWAVENEFGLSWAADGKVFSKVIANGHLHILEWAHKTGLNWNITGDACVQAVGGGHLEILKWAFQHGGELKGVCESAAWDGKLFLLYQTAAWLPVLTFEAECF